MTVLPLAELAADILRCGVPVACASGIRLVGIDGPSGSGKSTLARRLAHHLDAPVVKIDDFVSWTDFAGWWPRFRGQVLDPLARGDAARYQVRDWAGDEFGTSLGGWRSQPWAPVVLLEGVTCTRAAAELAYRVWVEAREPVRLARGLRRDGESHRQLWLDWMAEERLFFTADGTRQRADVRIDSDSSVAHDPVREVVTLP